MLSLDTAARIVIPAGALDYRRRYFAVDSPAADRWETLRNLRIPPTGAPARLS